MIVPKNLKDLEHRKNRVFELYEDGKLDKRTKAQRIEIIELHFDEDIQNYFINNKEGESSNNN